ncbi:hypothetical protein [Azospirillum sp. Sh1]|uniref:hypothetical protein n=1 Tax=Azospirillum sp. Sh1 TaxID=2607285 RepID=UPI001B3BCF71|nr:hypothetical protein [Azospirillum sp. Sh1]
MNIDAWVSKAESCRGSDNIFYNFKFETQKNIANKSTIKAFEMHLSGCSDKDDHAFILEYFCRKYGLVKMSGSTVDHAKFGPRLSTVVKWFVAKDTLLSTCVHDPSFESRLEYLSSIDDHDEYIEELGKLSREVDESLKSGSVKAGSAAAVVGVGSGGKSYATTTVTIAPPDLNRIGEPETLTVCWLAPERELNEKIESMVGKDASPSRRLAAAINVLGLKPDRKPYDLRFVFTFDGTAFPAEAVRRPTIFAGGFPDCYLSADKSDGWGRTEPLNDGVDMQACEEGVPEAVCSGLPLQSAANINLVGFLTASQYKDCGCPKPGVAAKRRFGEEFCLEHDRKRTA